jgi:MFS family permease
LRKARSEAQRDGLGRSFAARLPSSFWRLMAVLLVFAVGNSADAFLLLRLGDVGVNVTWMPVLWALLHVIKAGTSYYGGALADRVGRRNMIAAGWLVYAVVYGGFAAFTSAAATVALFLVYGIYFGLSEGPERALVADLTPHELRGTAFGWYNATVGVGLLVASVTFGWLWFAFGPAVAFTFGASLALAATLLLFALVPEPRA